MAAVMQHGGSGESFWNGSLQKECRDISLKEGQGLAWRWAAGSGCEGVMCSGWVTGCGGAASGSNVRKNEAEKIAKWESGIFVLAVGCNATLASTQTKYELQTRFSDVALARMSSPAPRPATGGSSGPLWGPVLSRPGWWWTSSRVSSELFRLQWKCLLGVLLEHQTPTSQASPALINSLYFMHRAAFCHQHNTCYLSAQSSPANTGRCLRV